MLVMKELPPTAAAPPILGTLLRAAPTPVIAWDLDGRVLASSDACRGLLGYSAEAMAAVTRTALFHPDDRRVAEARMRRRREGDRDPETFEARLWTANKRVVHVRGNSAPIVEGDRVTGDVVWYSLVESELGEALERQSEQYLALFERISDAVYVLDGKGLPSWMNRAAERLFGRTVEVMRKTPRREILSPEAERGQDALRLMFSSGESVPDEIQFRIKRPDGDERWVRGSLLMVRDSQGRHASSIVIARDVTEDRRRERELREAAARSELEAKIDPLTGLGNRRAFDEATAAAAPSATLLIMDVDGLKQINDVTGHTGGDDALRAVARSLSSRTRAGDQMFRISGDEFAIITESNDPAVLVERLRDPIRFREPVPWITLSVGMARWDKTSDVFELADSRMYAMKRTQD